MAIHNFRLNHAYNISRECIHFTFEKSNNIEEHVIELAVYLQFKAENSIDICISLSDEIVVRFLTLFGAQVLDVKPDYGSLSCTHIDMYQARESRCGYWYNEKYTDFDKKYGEKAEAFLLDQAEENKLMGELP